MEGGFLVKVKKIVKAFAEAMQFCSLVYTCLFQGPEIGEKIAQLFGHPAKIGYVGGAFFSLIIFVVVFVISLLDKRQENNLTYSEVA